MRHEHSSKTKTLRKLYGLTQQQLADYLGISRAHLSMHEQNRRLLPPDAGLKLSQIALHHHKNPIHMEQWLYAEADNTMALQYIKAVKKAIWLKKNELLKAEKLLQTTKKKFEQGAHLAHYFKHNPPNSDMEKGDRLWHELHSMRGHQHLRKFALPAQLLQQLEVDSLTYFIENANKLLQQLESKQPAKS